MPISEIAVGDTVLAYNERTGEIGAYTVTDTISHIDETIVHLTIDGELIETTAEHPFLTDDGLWIDAVELEIGEQVLSLDGDYGRVEAVVVVEDANQPMYNLTVAEVHTFIVGEGAWVVHNDTNLQDAITNFLNGTNSLSLYTPGTYIGFSGVYHYDTGLFLARPSGNLMNPYVNSTLLTTGEIPYGLVSSRGGHADVFSDMLEMLDLPSGTGVDEFAGFSLQYRVIGELNVGWLSGQVNLETWFDYNTKFGHEVRELPEPIRQPIRDAVVTTTGCRIRG